MSFVGPRILARTMSVGTKKGKGRTGWQYHSRSDGHSKVACWTLLFDLLCECDAARRLAESGRLGFGINHVMVGPINKTLDLVLTVVDETRRARGARKTFSDMVGVYGIVLEPDEATTLSGLPVIRQDLAEDISEVVVAIEAKACMTAHVKSLPRLHAEVLATGWLARQAAPRCITVSYNLVNEAESFLSPGQSAPNRHVQPQDARQVVDMLKRAIPLARHDRGFGYDAVGVTVIDARNDGSPITVSSGPAAPRHDEHVHYERMMVALCGELRDRFR